MNNFFKIFFTVLAVLLTACQNSIGQDVEGEVIVLKEKKVTIKVNALQTALMDVTSTDTRATPLSQGADFLTVAFVDSKGTIANTITQTATLPKEGSSTGETVANADFGKVSLMLKYGIYKVIIVANKKAPNADALKVISESRVETTRGKVTDTFYYMGDLTVEANTASNFSVSLSRAVALFGLIADDKPDDVTRLVVTMTGGSNIFNPSTGFGAEKKTQVSEFDVSASNTIRVGLYTFLTTAAGTVNVTVVAYDASGKIVCEREFIDVEMSRNYRTYFEGNLFSEVCGANIDLASTEWAGTNTIN